MDVVLPEPDGTDSVETRWALETARTLWGQGDRREALQWVRRAAEAAAESGQDDRALLLAKQGAEIRHSLDIPRTVPPPAPAAATQPAASTGNPSSPSLTGIVPPGIPRPAAVPSIDGSAAPAAVPTAKSVAAPAVGVSVVPAVAPTSIGPARPASQVPPSERGDEIVVTVVQSDGIGPTPDASLVSRRAVRVAVIAVDTPNELRVKKLAPGEVAPKDSTVAILVAFEPGASPVPETPPRS
jgi:hypothetical protein